MSEQSATLMKETHRLILDSADRAIRLLAGTQEAEVRTTLPEDVRDILAGIRIRKEEGALRALIVEAARQVAFGIFAMIDGAAYGEEGSLPDIALINRGTGKDLTEGLLHDEFYEFASD